MYNKIQLKINEHPLFDYTIIVKLSILIFCFSSIAISETNSKEKVASVGDEIIYLDEIFESSIGENIESQKRNLLRIIEISTLKQELDKVILDNVDDIAQQNAKIRAEEFWENYGTTEMEREVNFKKELTLYKVIYKALVLWNKDKAEGDKYAEIELNKIGAVIEDWNRVQTLALQDPDLEEKYIAWSRKPKTSYKDLFIELYQQQLYQQELSELKLEILKKTITPDVSVSNTEIDRLYDLLMNIEWLDFRILLRSIDELEKVRKLTLESEQEFLEIVKDPTPKKNRYNNRFSSLKRINPHLIIITLYIDSLEKGSISKIFKWKEYNKIYHSIFYIDEIKRKPENLIPSDNDKEILKIEVVKFKRNNAFDIWLWSKMKENTEIYHSDYQDIFD